MLALRVDCPDGFRGIKFIEIQISSQWKVLIFPFAYINSVIVKLRIAYSLASINLSPLPSTYPQPWSAEKKGSFVFLFIFFSFFFFCFFSIVRVRDKRSRTNARFCVAVTNRRKNDRGCCHSSSPWSQSRFQGSWASPRESRPRCGRFSSTRQISIAGRRIYGLDLLRPRIVTSTVTSATF